MRKILIIRTKDYSDRFEEGKSFIEGKIIARIDQSNITSTRIITMYDDRDYHLAEIYLPKDALVIIKYANR